MDLKLKIQMTNKDFLALLAGILVGLSWFLYSHVLLHPDLFFLQKRLAFQYSMQLGVGDFFTREWKRWYSFFWESHLHRNMFWLGVFGLAIVHAVKGENMRITCLLCDCRDVDEPEGHCVCECHPIPS